MASPRFPVVIVPGFCSTRLEVRPKDVPKGARARAVRKGYPQTIRRCFFFSFTLETGMFFLGNETMDTINPFKKWYMKPMCGQMAKL